MGKPMKLPAPCVTTRGASEFRVRRGVDRNPAYLRQEVRTQTLVPLVAVVSLGVQFNDRLRMKRRKNHSFRRLARACRTTSFDVADPPP